MISKEINIQDIYTLSHTQEGMLYHSIYSPGSDVYTQQINFTLRGNLDKSLFTKAWQMVIDRHPILRTVFDWSTREKPLQIVYKTIPLPFKFKDWQNFTLDEQADNLRSLLLADFNKGFDLSKTPLIRLILIQMSKEKFQFIWTSHHIILDGWSVFLILKDLFSLYEALIQGGELYLKPCPPYKNFIAWLKKQNLQEAEKFWKYRLKGFKTPTQLWITKSPADAQNRSQSFNDYIGKISSELTLELKSFAKEYQLTINTLIQGIWALMISKYSGEDDVLFGATVSGRREPEDVDKMVGLFINTLPVRFQINKDDSIISWLKKNQYEQVETIQYDFSPLVQIHQWSEVPNDQPLFDQILVFENYPIEDYFSNKERIVGIENIDSVERTNYSLSVIVLPEKELELKFIYDKNKFEQKTIENLILHFQTILEGIVKNPTLLIKQLHILSVAENSKILVEWNQTQTEFPDKKCLHQLFQEQAQRTPNSIAVAFNNEMLTYSELNQKSDLLSRHLVSLGVNPNELVAILLDRSINMMVALLGVLKAGGAYLPLDPEFPYERLEFMLEDAQVKTLITHTNFLDNLPSCSAEIVCIDDYKTNAKFENIINDQVNSEDLAYVIYTSGSTGKPKGVQVTHKSVVNFLNSMTKKPGFKEGDTLLAVTTLSFDISILELFLPIINGGKTIIASKDIVANGEQLLHTLKKHRVNVMQATPTTWRLLIEAGWNGNKNFKVLCGGESLSIDLAEKLLSCSDNVWNMYGPTETTVWSACHKLEQDGKVLIGTPIDNTLVYVLDKNMQPVPISIPGELYIGGMGVSQGYLNRPELTADRFLINPFIENTKDKIYKTGDLVRFNKYGKLEYLNRIDQQVKIRGFRIELGEIENVLGEHESINLVAVTAYEHQKDDTRLVAYIVLNSSSENSEENRSELVTQLRDFVKKKLPAYMIPTSFIFMEKLPLTPNGKIDRKALPKPDQSIYGLENNYVAPQNETEEKLVEIWKKVLKVEKVGLNDNFFELGGHSLLAVYLFNQIELNFNKKLPLALLFEASTLSEMALAISDIINNKLVIK
jgi:amino acid adenylation domain-containing protein